MSGPYDARVIEERHGSAGARRALGGVGAMSGPPRRTRDRGAPRLRRGATSVGGGGGHVGAPTTHGGSGRAAAPPGRPDPCGGWGAARGPHERRVAGPSRPSRDRGAPRLRRGATSVGGCGGHVGAPTINDEYRER